MWRLAQNLTSWQNVRVQRHYIQIPRPLHTILNPFHPPLSHTIGMPKLLHYIYSPSLSFKWTSSRRFWHLNYVCIPYRPLPSPEYRNLLTSLSKQSYKSRRFSSHNIYTKFLTAYSDGRFQRLNTANIKSIVQILDHFYPLPMLTMYFVRSKRFPHQTSLCFPRLPSPILATCRAHLCVCISLT